MITSKVLKKAMKLYLAHPNPCSNRSFYDRGTTCPRGAVRCVLYNAPIPFGAKTGDVLPQGVYVQITSTRMRAITNILNAAAREVGGADADINSLGNTPKKAKKAFRLAIKAAKQAEESVSHAAIIAHIER